MAANLKKYYRTTASYIVAKANFTEGATERVFVAKNHSEALDKIIENIKREDNTVPYRIKVEKTNMRTLY